jgi:protein-disulfide isomerase
VRKNIESPATSLSKRKMRLWLLRAGFALFALVAVSCGGPGAEQRAADPAGDEPAGSEEQAAVDLEHPSLGDEDAPVVLTEYADYQ